MSVGSSMHLLVFHTSRRYSATRMPTNFCTPCERASLFNDAIGQSRPSAPGLRAARLRVEQPMQVDDEVAHMRVVDGALRLGLPGGVGRCVVRIDADEVEPVEIAERDVVELLELSAEHEMQQLLGSGLTRHRLGVPTRARPGTCPLSAASMSASPGLGLAERDAPLAQQVAQYRVARSSGRQ